MIHYVYNTFLQVMKYEPLIAWLPGLANPRSYLLTVLQSACRKYHWPIEQAGLVAQITNAEHLPAPRDVRNFPLHYRLANALTSIFLTGYLRKRNLPGERRLGQRAAVLEKRRGVLAVGCAARRPNHCDKVRAGTTSGEKNCAALIWPGTNLYAIRIVCGCRCTSLCRTPSSWCGNWTCPATNTPAPGSSKAQDSFSTLTKIIIIFDF